MLSADVFREISKKYPSSPTFSSHCLVSDSEFGTIRSTRLVATPVLGMRFGLANQRGVADKFSVSPEEANSHRGVSELFSQEGVIKTEQGLSLKRLFEVATDLTPNGLMALVEIEFGFGSGDLERGASSLAVLVPGMVAQTLPVFRLSDERVIGLVWPGEGDSAAEGHKTSDNDLSFQTEIVSEAKASKLGVVRISLGPNGHELAFAERRGGKEIGRQISSVAIAPSLPIAGIREGLALPIFVPRDPGDRSKLANRQSFLSSEGSPVNARLRYVIAEANWFSNQ
jgi:hypothetical protein